MKRFYKLSHQLVAYVLLISLLLQSCGGELNNNPLIPAQEERLGHIQTHVQEVIPQTNTETLVDQEFTAQGGHAVTFYEEAGHLQAEVKEEHGSLSRTYTLPVYIEEGMQIKELAEVSKKRQQQLLEVVLPTSQRPGYAYVSKGRGKLLGGTRTDNVAAGQPTNTSNVRLADYIELRRYFNKGNLEITSANYNKLVETKYSEALANFDKGVIVKGWKSSTGFGPLEDILLNLNHIKSLKLHLVWDTPGNALELVTRCVQFYNDLEELDIAGCGLDNLGLQEIIESLPVPDQLKSLNVAGNSSISLAGLKLSLASLPNLQTITSDIAEAQNILAKHTQQAVAPNSGIRGVQEATDSTGPTSLESIDHLQLPPVLAIKALAGTGQDYYELGTAFYKGEEVAQDYGQAFVWYKKAALENYLEAQNSIKAMLLREEGFFEETEDAFTAMNLAAKNRDPLAYMVLGWMYKNGKGTRVDAKEAFKWHKKAASKKLTLSQYEIGVSYAYGQGIKKDLIKAKKWLQRAAKKGHKLAKEQLEVLKKPSVEPVKSTLVNPKNEPASQAVPIQQQQIPQARAEVPEKVTKPVPLISHEAERQYQLGKNSNGQIAVEHFTKASDLGHPAAKYELADLYWFGLNDIERDQNKGLKIYHEAATLGNSDAQATLGHLYYTGEEELRVPKDLAKAKFFWEAASAQGNASAQAYLASLYRHGEGVRQNLVKAKELYLQAAAQGNSAAQEILGSSAFDLKELEKQARKGDTQAQYELGTSNLYFNDPTYFNWIQTAAKQGHMEAQFTLATAYRYGWRGVAEDSYAAKEWYEKAAQQGHAEAYYRLGDLYYYGFSIREDKAKAVECYLKAAELGYGYGFHLIASYYKDGRHGLPKDAAKAKEMEAKEEATKEIEKVKEEKNKAYFQIELDKFRRLAAQGKVDIESALQEPGSVSTTQQQGLQAKIETHKSATKAAPQIGIAVREDSKEAQGLYKLGKFYFEGLVKDEVNAKDAWERAANLGHVKAKQALEALLSSNKAQPAKITIIPQSTTTRSSSTSYQQENTSYKASKATTRQGQVQVDSPESQYERGLELYNKDDFSQAAEFFNKAAQQGHAEAQYKLGLMYKNGWGVKRQNKLMYKWWEKAVKQGHAEAQYNLAYVYCHVEHKFFKARKLYEKAANQGHAEAQCELGALYCVGVNVVGFPKDYNKAKEWFEKSATQGNPGAQWNMGVFYYKGQGVPQDYNKARGWFEKGVAQNHTNCQNWLGYLYQYGQGVQQDYDKAKDLYEKASAQGNKNAQANLQKLNQIINPSMSQPAYQGQPIQQQGRQESSADQFMQRVDTINNTVENVNNIINTFSNLF